MEDTFTNLLRERNILTKEFKVLKERLRKELLELKQYNIKARKFNRTVSKETQRSNSY